MNIFSYARSDDPLLIKQKKERKQKMKYWLECYKKYVDFSGELDAKSIGCLCCLILL